jgi:predicted Co/Zn/Cd cation transporter (cation efflux family)
MLLSLAATLSLAETVLGSYEAFARRSWFAWYCFAELGLIAVAVAVLMLRRMGFSGSGITLGLLTGSWALAAALVVATGLNQGIADHLLNDMLPGTRFLYGPDAARYYANETRMNVTTTLVPALGMILFWPAWLLTEGRRYLNRAFLSAAIVALAGVAGLLLLTWTVVLDGVASHEYTVFEDVLHAGLVILTWCVATVVWRRRTRFPSAQLPRATSTE